MLSEYASLHPSLPDMLKPLIRAFIAIYGQPPSFDDGALPAAFRAWLARGQTQWPSKSEAAAHECGHVAAYAAAGVPLIRVKIYPAHSKPGAWLGLAYHAPCHLPLIWSRDPELFSLLACLTLAGPIAEEIIGGGHALRNLTELWRARAFSDRAAEVSDNHSSALWGENVWRAVASVEHYAPQISALAKILERRCEITPELQRVSKVLQNIPPGARIPWKAVSPKGKTLAHSIIADTPCIADLLAGKSAQ